MRRIHNLSLALALAAAGLLAAGCSFTKFDDYEEKAPASKIEQEGDISSGTFGLTLTGLARQGSDGNVQEGGLLIVGANAAPAINNVSFSVDGSFSNSQSPKDDVKDKLEDPDRINTIVAATGLSDANPTGLFNGPFVYVGTTKGVVGSVLVIDVNKYDGPAAVRQTDLKGKGGDNGPPGFGIGIAPTAIRGVDKRDDLAIGCAGQLVLWPAKSWPNFEAADAIVIDSGPGWPASGQFEVLATGDLDLSNKEDEVVVAAPEKNYVAIVHHIPDCLTQGSCATVRQVPLPDKANGFGKALLVADVDGDGKNELVVGAPDTDGQRGAIYVYKFHKDHFVACANAGDKCADGASTCDSNKQCPMPDPKIVQPTNNDAAKEFGAALAHGQFEGPSAPGGRKLLAVGAPASDGADGDKSVIRSGKLLFYDSALSAAVSQAQLATPVERDLLGRALTAMPFRVGNTTYQVLAASAVSGVYTFWSFLTEKHEDIRSK